MAIWYIFPRFGIFCREKSGNPANLLMLHPVNNAYLVLVAHYSSVLVYLIIGRRASYPQIYHNFLGELQSRVARCYIFKQKTPFG
jgi:hypothetical protein